MMIIMRTWCAQKLFSVWFFSSSTVQKRFVSISSIFRANIQSMTRVLDSATKMKTKLTSSKHNGMRWFFLWIINTITSSESNSFIHRMKWLISDRTHYNTVIDRIDECRGHNFLCLFLHQKKRIPKTICC